MIKADLRGLGTSGASSSLHGPSGIREIGFKRPKKTGLAAFATRSEAGALLAAVVAFVFFSIFAEKFLTLAIWGNIFLLSAELGIVAIGATLLMIAGEFGLSVGSVLGLSSGIVILLFNAGVLGVVTLAMIKQGLILMGINADMYRAGSGLLLIVAAVLNQYVRENRLRGGPAFSWPSFAILKDVSAKS